MADERREGRGRSEEGKGTMTVAEAGQKGGEKTAETHGHEFYKEIGQKGGESRSEGSMEKGSINTKKNR